MLVADSDFMALRNYNVIYCKDLYKKSLDQIMEYLKLQHKILVANNNTYTVQKLVKNKKVLFDLSSNKVNEIDPIKRAKQLNALDQKEVFSIKIFELKLNDISLAKSLSTLLGGLKKETPTVHISSKEQQQLVQQLDSPAKKFAAIQFLSMTTDSSKAKNALSKDAFGMLSVNQISDATRYVASIMPTKGKISAKDADDLVAGILSSNGVA
jgi:hypothetical protein